MKDKEIKEALISELTELGKKLNRRPKKRDSNYLNCSARKFFCSWNNFMQKAGYKVRFHQKISLPKFDENFAYFLGLMYTDGHIRYDKKRCHYKVAIYTSFEDERDFLLKIIKKLFNYDAAFSSRMYGFSKRPNYELRISSKYLARILIERFGIFSGNKSLSIRISNKIKESRNSIKESFLRGVIDGDGCIQKRFIKITSGSTGFLKDIKELLDKLNISSGNICRDNKVTNTFAIRINRCQDLLKIKKIYSQGYSYKRKKESIDKI